jgi:NADP-dependent 3-hydroxy acid dehydrogenase YdfG
MKTIFITGASAGLSKATAKLFQAKGWKVIASMRTPEQETELKPFDNVILLPLDITDRSQVQQTVNAAFALIDISLAFFGCF